MNGLLAYILAMLFGIFVLLAIVAFGKWRKLSKERELRSLVVWSIIPDHPLGNISGHDLPLWSYISNAQIEFKLPQEYRISGDDEWAYAKEILDEYQKDLTQSYFKGHLKLIRSKYEVRGEDYFMCSLYAFLSEHQCDFDFLGHNMHGDRFNTGSTTTYTQTDFAIVLHKMHYITYMYCRGSEILKHLAPEWNKKKLQEILDTKQIMLFRY